MEQSLTEPGERSPAPGRCAVIQLFVNTNDLETGPDLLPDAGALRDWLVAHELLGEYEPVTAEDHARAIELREAIRGPGLGPRRARPRPSGRRDRQRGGPPPRPECPCSRTRRRASSRRPAGWTARSATSSPPSTPPIAEGTSDYLKACERDVCRWAFYDHSKNRSGHWCSMAVCGQREKNRRAYRRRRARAA